MIGIIFESFSVQRMQAHGGGAKSEEHRKEMTFLANLETLSLPKFVDLSQANPWTKFCAPIVRSPIFKQSVELVLWANMILLVIQYDGQGEMLAYIDEILQGVFTACFTMRPSWS